jgi:hypothetical protein
MTMEPDPEILAAFGMFAVALDENEYLADDPTIVGFRERLGEWAGADISHALGFFVQRLALRNYQDDVTVEERKLLEHLLACAEEIEFTAWFFERQLIFWGAHEMGIINARRHVQLIEYLVLENEHQIEMFQQAQDSPKYSDEERQRMRALVQNLQGALTRWRTWRQVQRRAWQVQRRRAMLRPVR